MYIFTMSHLINRFLKSTKGVISIEYGLGMALIGIVMAVSITDTSVSMRSYMTKIATG
jgi:Flp pilus assembly pilin Flp